MTNYARGRSKEYAACKALRDDGYCAQRTAGSHGVFDITAVSATTIKLVQVKYTDSGYWQDGNVELLKQLPVPPSTNKEIWVYRKGISQPTIHVL